MIGKTNNILTVCRPFYKITQSQRLNLNAHWHAGNVGNTTYSHWKTDMFWGFAFLRPYVGCQRWVWSRVWSQLQDIRLANVLVTLGCMVSSLDETPINHNMSWPLRHAPYHPKKTPTIFHLWPSISQ